MTLRGRRWALAVLGIACGGDAPPTDSGTPGAFAAAQAVFDRSCTSSGCHGRPERETGLALTADVSWAALVGVPSTELPTMNRVEPGDPHRSYLLRKLEGTHLDVGGTGELMPPGFGLAGADVAVIRDWITEGAPDAR